MVLCCASNASTPRVVSIRYDTIFCTPWAISISISMGFDLRPGKYRIDIDNIDINSPGTNIVSQISILYRYIDVFQNFPKIFHNIQKLVSVRLRNLPKLTICQQTEASDTDGAGDRYLNTYVGWIICSHTPQMSQPNLNMSPMWSKVSVSGPKWHKRRVLGQ